MTRTKRGCKCKNCRELFIPDYRNVGRQNYCGKPECRKASKADSQRRWLNKPENRDYFRSPHHVDRVREWRKKHPEHGGKKKPAKQEVLQDSLQEESQSKQEVEPQFVSPVLQDACSSQTAVIIGLIAHLTGQVLQDDIAATARRLQEFGNDILNRSHQGGTYDLEASRLSGPGPPGSGAVQLGGSPSGP